MQEFPYTVVRSARRRHTMKLTVATDDTIVVTVPRFVREAEVAELVRRKSDWIRSRFQKNAEFRRRMPVRVFAEGEGLPWLGRELPLRVTAAPRLRGVRVERRAQALHVAVPLKLARDASRSREKIKGAVESWYAAEARADVGLRLARFVREFAARGVSLPRAPGRVNMRKLKSRWGSCSSRGDLSFNWKLWMAPPEIVDYVVVHELAHLLEQNHSRAFWAVVARVLPDHARRRAWLRKNGPFLEL